MKYLTLRNVISFCILIISFSICIQCYLIGKIYASELDQFNFNVQKSFESLVANKMLRVAPGGMDSKIEINGDGYLLQYDSVSSADFLYAALAKEFTDYHLFLSFHLAMYDPGFTSYKSQQHIEYVHNSFQKAQGEIQELLPTPSDRHYLYLEFPGRRGFLFKAIQLWVLSGTFLVISMTVPALILFYYYKHKFWNEVQKPFINNFIHECKTPISVISIAGKVLQSDGIELHPARMKKYARIIKGQTDQLQRKVDQILELSISGKKYNTLEKRLLEVNDIVSNAISFVEPLVQERKATIEIVLPDEPVRIYADGSYLTQAIINLLDNSLKYAHLPQIRLETAASDKDCIISVKDNGIGIDKKYIKHIFRKYYRIPTGNIHNVKGFGIGLNFVKNVIDAHNGRIEVSSVTGKGTEIRIKLPVT